MTAILPLFTPGKAPSEVKDFSYDFKHILARHEQILTAAVTASPSGLVIGTPVISKSIVSVWISSGTLDTSYTVSYAITTDQNRSETRAVILNCQTI